MAGGDYKNYKDLYTDKTTDLDILTGTAAYANVIAAKSAAHQIFIQKITLSITTHVAADRYLFDDDGAGAEVAAHTDAAAGAGVDSVIVWDFGPKGTPLAVGANLDVSHSGAGVAKVHIEAYERLMTPISYLSGAALQ
jgi:hypothetical protein